MRQNAKGLAAMAVAGAALFYLAYGITYGITEIVLRNHRRRASKP